MEKETLLQTTQNLIQEATPKASDVLLQAGFLQIQKNLLNYYREDLDYPPHSARAIVKLSDSMLRWVGSWDEDALLATWPLSPSLKALRDIWSIEIGG